jgi:hypothetical protein
MRASSSIAVDGVLHAACIGSHGMTPAAATRCLALAALLAGCDRLFGLEDLALAPDAAGAMVGGDGAVRGGCVVDPFDALGSDWTVFASPPRTAVAIDGTLTVALDKAADVYGGIRTAPRDLTGYSTEVDLVQLPSVLTDTYLDWARGDDWYSIAVDHGQLSYGWSVNDSGDTIEIPYVASEHRTIRIAHDPSIDVVRFSVRNSAGGWIQLSAVPIAIPLTAVQIEIASGSYTAATADGFARFDNLVVCSP